MGQVSTIGLDIAKRVFQVHGVDAAGAVVFRRQLRRTEVLRFFAKQPPCLVGIEACGSAHYWGREIAALGHQVRLMPPTRVKPYVKWGRKNDKVDAAACCEAVSRPSMRFVPLKTVEQQAALMLHRARQLLVEQRTRLGNAIRAHLAEIGIVAAKGQAGLGALLAMLGNPADEHVPAVIRPILMPLVEQWRSAAAQIAVLERQILAWHRNNPDSQRLATIPQFGPILSSAMVATLGEAARFDSGRRCSAWIGLVPKENSSGGRERLGGISKTGDRYLRQLLVVAASGLIGRARAHPEVAPWFAALLARMPAKQAAVALANKMARIAWAVLTKKTVYRAAAGTLTPPGPRDAAPTQAQAA
jgi:transposase